MLILRTTNEFESAISQKRHVEVWLKDKCFCTGGPIEAYNSTFVTINGITYPTVAYEFRIS